MRNPLARSSIAKIIFFIIGLYIIKILNEEHIERKKSRENIRPGHSRELGQDFLAKQSQDYKLYEKHRRFPDFLIVGASKCGTNVLKHYLHGNPYFVHTNIEDPHYFDNMEHFKSGPEYYMSLMPKVYPYHRVFESTPSYFSSKLVPGRVYDFDSSMKIVILVCDPISRALAHYFSAESTKMENGEEHLLPRNFVFTATTAEEGLMDAIKEIFPSVVVEMMQNDPDFNTEDVRDLLHQYLHQNGDRKPANFLTRGAYGYHIRHWFKYFPRDQILILNENDLRKEPWKVLNKVQEFADVDQLINISSFVKNETSGWYCLHGKSSDHVPNCAISDPVNDSQKRINAEFTPQTKQVLSKIFKSVEDDLTEVFGHKFKFVRETA
ncbi:Oidioi.mRNA.OKI2018_I69.chr1.g762.t1.cds [Oikopleura dioica]|uniref:Sulfotransferase n=1 Tax=Oikopleura dioica TaxID=34765 RepID=A0ABN7SQU4_OIKDI|nr:Oidioi.mRNA.OKI2018_I69.chr1.g762.t1.cds [Oikopleura dioica]